MKIRKDYSNQELLADIQSSREEVVNRAFAFLYQKYFQSFVYFVQTNHGQEEEAKDVFQEGIIVFYKKARQQELDIDYPATFFYSICKNIWAERGRQKANRERILRDITRADDNTYDNLEATLEKERDNMLWVLVEKLGPDCQAVLLNFYYEKKNMKEIALAMNLASEAVAKNKKSNCMKKLREIVLSNRKYWEVLKQ
jgi:RNA polymerase sigma factor (sigma-70 family)